MQPTQTQAYLAILAGIIGATFATPFIRLTQEAGMPSPAIVAGRLSIFAVVFTPIIAQRGGFAAMRAVPRRQWVIIAAAGAMLAGHFVTFISALEYTSVLGTLVFSSTTPIFAAIFTWLFLREAIRRAVWIGILIAFVGTVLYVMGGTGGTPPTRFDPLLGNSLSLTSAVLLALYFTVGRRVRGTLDSLSYSWLVFSIAGVTAWLALPFFGVGVLGYTLEAYLWLLAVTLFAQLIAHSSWNFALGTLPAPIVSMALLVIPVTGTVSAFFILDERPATVLSVIGSLVILVGVGVANRSG